MALTLRDTAHHTYREYRAWSEDVRYELIDGVAYLMAPTPARVHQEVVGEMYRQTANTLHGRPCRPFIAPFDVRLPRGTESDDQVDTVVQPDLLVVCDPLKLDERGMRGAPDWVVEVLSPASASHDQTIKLAAYERAGVSEVWVVHPTDRTVTSTGWRARATAGPPFTKPKEILWWGLFLKYVSTGVWFFQRPSLRALLTSQFGSFSKKSLVT